MEYIDVATSYSGYLQFCMLVACIFLSSSAQSQAQDQISETKIAAVRGWGRLKQESSRPFTATASMIRTDTLTDKPKVTTFRLKQNRDCYLFEILTPSGVTGDRLQYRQVSASNSHYSFTAVDRGSGWVVTIFDTSHERFDRTHDTAKKIGFDYLNLAWTVGGHSFPEVFDSPGFKTSYFGPVGVNSAGTSQLVFSVPKSANPSKDLKVGIDKGTIDFDASNKWRITKYDYKLPVELSGGTVSGVLKYHELDGFVEHFEQTMILDAKYQSKVVISTDSLEVRDVPEFDFSLSAYGLPEPPGVVWEGPTPTYVWLLIAAGGFGVVALGCRWLLTRRAKTTPPVPPTSA